MGQKLSALFSQTFFLPAPAFTEKELGDLKGKVSRDDDALRVHSMNELNESIPSIINTKCTKIKDKTT